MVLIPYEKIKVLRQVPGKDFEELDVDRPGGARESSSRGWQRRTLTATASRNCCCRRRTFSARSCCSARRALPNSTNLGAWTFTVKEQINGAGSNSRLVGAAAVPNGTNAIPSLFLLDAERKVLTLCERDRAGVWQVVRNVPLPVSDFTSLQPIALGAGKTNALAFLGLNAVACMPLDGQVWELTELDSYETPIKDGYLNDVVTGDLDNDGRKDLVFLETARNYLDLVIFDANHKLVPANRWQVFEERTFRGRRGEFPEPREAVGGRRDRRRQERPDRPRPRPHPGLSAGVIFRERGRSLQAQILVHPALSPVLNALKASAATAPPAKSATR